MDIRGTLAQLEAIRHDLKYGGSIPSGMLNQSFAATDKWSVDVKLPDGKEVAEHGQQQQPCVHKLGKLPPTSKETTSKATTKLPGQGSNPAMKPDWPTPSGYLPGVAPAQVFPALTTAHFAADGQTTALLGEEGFDSAAYAAYQQLFDVPGGDHAPVYAIQRQTGFTQQTDTAAQHTVGHDQPLPTARNATEQQQMAQLFKDFLQTAEAQQILQAALQQATDGSTDQGQHWSKFT